MSHPTHEYGYELERLTLLLHREILRLRASYQLSLDEFRGLYVSDEQIDRLVDESCTAEAAPDAASVCAGLTARAAALRRAPDAPIPQRWRLVVEEFELGEFEADVLLLALAPELELRFETIYAYLNNDVTRRHPAFDLALRLFATHPDDLALLAPSGKLLAEQLIVTVNESGHWLARGFELNPIVRQWLLGRPAAPSSRADDLLSLAVVSPTAHERLVELTRWLPQSLRQRERPPIIVLEGRYGSGRRAAAAAIAAACDRTVLDFDGRDAASAEQVSRSFDELLLRQRLSGAGIYVSHIESFLERMEPAAPMAGAARAFQAAAARTTGLVFLSVEPSTPWQPLLRGLRSIAIAFDEPTPAGRGMCWAHELGQVRVAASDADLAAVANGFVLTPGQIRDAAKSVCPSPQRADDIPTQVNLHGLSAAARAQSMHALNSVASRVQTSYGWDDLILPAATIERLRSMAAAVRHRDVVYGVWGMSRGGGGGASAAGVRCLFAGASGTGKTMTASVIANDLDLELYRVDLSTILSRWVGEAEKAMDRVFRAAYCSNAIVFFDECDALFGKRAADARDAQDHYVNAQVAFLLQRLEDHPGVVILATNLPRNLDDAFSRRLHHVIDFPLPDESHRARLWQRMFPPAVPLGDDVDFAFLARQFKLAGGDIRNVALDAAFAAAADGRVVTMQLLLRAVARQLTKSGTVPSMTQFKQYYVAVAERVEGQP